ncbi:gonadotropin subunit beta-2-like [Corythoichthys intestinalis]|uniref:gonadotropin subunit beta-2-like n=1 Tax=Corythoichthys intestinalis TaxID=161448 RepID=UPI0025A6280A|nr:gonadotropin subunit beta-2-like [Corythoichthys intestinalis]
MTFRMFTLYLAAYSVWWMDLAATTKLPGCHLTKQKVRLEKEGCFSCHLVETTICTGYCATNYPISYDMPIEVPNVCMYEHEYHQQYELSDCLPGVDPMVKYPVALKCKCAACSILTSNCNEAPMEHVKSDFCSQMSAK